ncbi:unnamed protein product [Closterium sp. NIES-54]
MVTTTTPGGQRVSICTCTRTGRHLATFTHRPRSSLYTLATEPPRVAASGQVSASGQVAASCSCRLLSHLTLLWHHRLGHASLPQLHGMHSRLLLSGLPRSLPPLSPSPAPPCLSCVKGQQRAAPHSFSFPPRTAPCILSTWTFRLQLRERFRQDLSVLRLHFYIGGEFSSNCQRSTGDPRLILGKGYRHVGLGERRSRVRIPVCALRASQCGGVSEVHCGWDSDTNLLRDFCCGEGILLSFMLLDSPQQNGIAEHRIGLVMEVAHTSMIHAAGPHFLWPFAVRYDVHQLNLWPRVSLPETSPTLRWTGEVGDASVFQVWGSRAFVRDMSADKLSVRAIPCVFLGFVPDAPGWQFYHPTSRRVLPSQDVAFDELVPFYRLFPYRSAPPPPSPLFLAPDPPPIDPLPPQGPAPSGVSQVLLKGAASGSAASGGAEPGGARTEGTGSWGAAPGGEEPGGAEFRGAEPPSAASSGGPAGASPRLSPQQLCAGGGGDGVTAGAEGSCAGDAGAGGAGDGGAGVGGTGARGAGAAGAGAVDPGDGGAGGTVRPRPYFVHLLQQVLGGPPSTSLTPPLLCPLPDQSQPPLLSTSPLPAPSPYTEQSSGPTERREPASRPVSPVRTAHRVPRSRPPPVPGTHAMALRPSSVPLRVPLPAPPESSLPEVPDRESDRARAASPTVSRLLATAVTDPSFESAASFALIAELLDFAAACRLDYATALVAESVSASLPSVRGECALGTDVLEDRQEDLECLAATVPRFASMLLAPEGDPDAPDIPTPRSYAEAITVDGMWIFRVKRPPGSPPAFKARYIARGFNQRQGVDYIQTFSPTPKMTTLRVLLHVAAQRDYELHSLDFSTAFLQGSLHEEIWLHRPPGFTGSFPAGTQWSLCRPVHSLRQAPREWHDMLRTTLAALGFAPSS